jgi:hypothetical protein
MQSMAMKRARASANPSMDAAVAKAFGACPANIRRRLMGLRALIFRVAASTAGVGKLEETLKWGEPAYMTSESGSGSTVRIGWKASAPTQYAMYFHCRTSLIETFRNLFPDEFTFAGNRAIVFEESDTVPMDALAFCVAAALTYHRRQRTREQAGG